MPAFVFSPAERTFFEALSASIVSKRAAGRVKDTALLPALEAALAAIEDDTD